MHSVYWHVLDFNLRMQRKSNLMMLYVMPVTLQHWSNIVMPCKNDALGYYPEYWSLNSNLAFQPSSSIVAFAQRYPQSAMAEKLSLQIMPRRKSKTSRLCQCPTCITLCDQCRSGWKLRSRCTSPCEQAHPLVYAEFKDVWLNTSSQPESCTGLGRLMLTSPLMTQQDRQQRLYAQLRAGQSGQAIATAQSISNFILGAV